MDRRTVLVLFSTLAMLLIGAAPASASSVTVLGVDNTSPSSAAGARTQYLVTFTGGALASGGTVTATFPSGTTFGSYGGGGVFDGATRIGNCPTPSDSTGVTTCTIYGSIAAGRTARLEFNGVTNPGQGTNYKFTVATSTDTMPANSAAYSVVAPGAFLPSTVANASPSNGAGARTQYLVSFNTSTSGGLSPTAFSTVDVTLPAGTGVDDYGGGGVFDGATRIGNCPTPDTTTLKTTCTIYAAIAAGRTARVELNGVTNPPQGTSYKVTVATSSDTTSTQSAAYTVVAPGTFSPSTVANASPSNGAGARTQYLISFNTSTTGGLSPTAFSTVDVTLPTGTSVGSYGGGGVFDGTTRIGNCPTPSATTLKTTCTIYAAIAAGRTARIELNGVTNPSAGTNYRVTVATSSDTTSTQSAAYTVVAPGTFSPSTVANASPSNGAGARTQYLISFNTSTTGGLSPTAFSTVDVTLPTGTSVGSYGGGGVFDGTTRIGNCPTPSATTLKTTCTIYAAIAAGRTARIELNGVTNPSAGTNYRVTVATSSDTAATQSAAYTVAGANALTNVTVTPANPAQSATTQYVITFTTSATGGLSGAAFSTVDVIFPLGTTFGSYSGGGVFDGATRIGNCPTPNTTTRQTSCTIYGAIGPSKPARLELNGVTNPASPGSYHVTVSTSSDAGPVDSPPATVSQATPTPTPVPAPTPTSAPTPVAGRTVVVVPVSGKVLVRRPGSNEFVELDATQGVPVGSTLDTKAGVIALTSVQSGGKPQTARFYNGIFKIGQTKTTTDLTLNEPLAPCGKGAKAAARKPKTRKLWGDGKGSFRTRGQYSAATVRGTKWLVQDSCAGTLTKVAKGVVSVRDNVKRKTILVKAGKSYLARPRR